MGVIQVLLVFNYLLMTCADFEEKDAHSTESNEIASSELELFPPNPTYAGQTRMPRTILKKLHSKAAFLTGLKLGAILSKKGFELGHGKIASTHSFQIFGKSVNSAMSLAYGNPSSLLPLLEDESQPGGSDPATRTGFKKNEEKVYKLTVVENPSNETTELLEALPSVVSDEKLPQENANENSAVVIYQNSLNEDPEVSSNFIEEHNKRVKEFNESLLRRKNSKIFM